jgi:hypothetical protein
VFTGPALPLADPNGNGFVEVVVPATEDSPNGQTIVVDASRPNWEGKVLALNPKHPTALRVRAKKEQRAGKQERSNKKGRR